MKCRPLDCTHSRTWTAIVKDRKRGGCPYCTNKKMCPCTSLAQAYREVAAEWGVRNGVLRPDSVSPHSDMKVWWQCRSTNGSLVEWEAASAPPCEDLAGQGSPQQTQGHEAASAEGVMG